ncbi:sugar ABC transporter permease [Paenibacillus popilliae]|uniref:Permease components n=1 Tax=Paenibacillus popilliae ATCC 14706 TaxID=1212764 RepID=M9M0P0_PAEPP|nr:sugar ABC transporter permease [Paenibacillus popilliae]GAC42404.1 permease components [Paenibacillus popilliae ATCC 14706]
MNKLKQKILHWSLEKKLIAAFSCFIIVPLLLIGGIVSWVYVDYNRNTMLDAAVENNRQIMNNIDTSLQPLLRLSMFPLQESTIYQIMRKEYGMKPYPMLERGRDFDTVNGLILNGIMLYSDLIDSAIIYHGHDHLIIGRSNSQYMNMSYLEKEFVHEPLRPITFFIVSVSTITGFQIYDQIAAISRYGALGSPTGATSKVVTYFYQHGIRYMNIGYGSAAVVLFFFIIMFITFLQKKLLDEKG